jgi:hypothetical protein
MNKYLLRRIGVASNADAVRPSLSECIELVLEQSDTLVGDVLDMLKAPVLKPLKAGQADAVDPGVRHAVTHLLDEQVQVRSTFGDALRRLVYHSGSQDFGEAPMSRLEDIRVFEVHALEAHIEQALARREVNRAVDQVLPLFNAQISALLGWTSVQPALNPLKPEAFVRALQETLGVCVADDAVRSVLLRPAAQALGQGMALLYRQTCDWLRSQGVGPVTAADARAARAGARPRKAETELDGTLEILDKLRALMGVESSSDGGGVRDFIHTVPAALVALQDMKMEEPMFQRLKRQALPAIVAAQQPSVQDMLESGQVLEQARNRQVGRQLGEEVVRLMFDQLGQDERIPAPVRLQLRLLEPAMLRLSLKDPRFFLDRSHPARIFMDRAVQYGIGRVSSEQDAVQGFSACLAQAVSGVLRRSTVDADAFVQAWELVDNSWRDFETARLQQQEAAEQARAHAAQRDELAARLSGVLMERLHGAGLPALVAGFLRGPWSQVLAESRLRSPGEDPDPRGYMALVDDLVWSVQRQADGRDYSRLVKLIPRLLARINEGLVLIRYPQEPLSIFLDELIALHERVLAYHRTALAAARGARAAGATAVPEADASAEPPPSELPPEPVVESDSALDVLASGDAGGAPVEAGDWADLLLGGVWVRARLTWISHNRSLFMFVSGSGLAHAMTRRTMDRLQTQGRLRLGFSPPEFDLQIDTVHGVLTPQPDSD